MQFLYQLVFAQIYSFILQTPFEIEERENLFIRLSVQFAQLNFMFASSQSQHE